MIDYYLFLISDLAVKQSLYQRRRHSSVVNQVNCAGVVLSSAHIRPRQENHHGGNHLSIRTGTRRIYYHYNISSWTRTLAIGRVSRSILTVPVIILIAVVNLWLVTSLITRTVISLMVVTYRIDYPHPLIGQFVYCLFLEFRMFRFNERQEKNIYVKCRLTRSNIHIHRHRITL